MRAGGEQKIAREMQAIDAVGRRHGVKIVFIVPRSIRLIVTPVSSIEFLTVRSRLRRGGRSSRPAQLRGIIKPRAGALLDITVSKATLICNRVTLFESIEVRRLKSQRCRRKPFVVARHLLGAPFVTSRIDLLWSPKSLQSQFLASARSPQWRGPPSWAGACTSCFTERRFSLRRSRRSHHGYARGCTSAGGARRVNDS